MEIKYEVDKRGLCLTKCPFGKKIGVSIARVGSVMGCVQCANFVSRNARTRIVICNADKETK